MPVEKTPQTEPIPGYRLIAPLGRGGFGEVWKCEAPGGLFKAIKFVDGQQDPHEDAPADEEWQAIERVKALRHPFLLSLDRVERVDSELIVVMELADRNLADRLQECLRRGLPGIPREELIGYLLEAAEALDLMNFQHGLQHLDVKPQNLFLVSNHVKVADFGLVNCLGRAVVTPGAFTPLYAAPETFRAVISPHCDQYSLAIVYQEMLTATLPYPGKNARQLMLQHTQGEPDLRALCPGDRPVVARALAKEPQQRFPSCMAFVRALAFASDQEPDRRPKAESRRPEAEMPPSAICHLPSALEGSQTTPGAHTAETAPAVRVGSRTASPVVPGYRVLGRVMTGPTQELWKVEGAGGKVRLAKLVFGFVRDDPHGQAGAISLLAALRHSNLISFEIADSSPGCLVLLSHLVEVSLRDRFQECRAQGLPGVPRRELLQHLRAAAEALDDLAEQQGVFHLGLNPRVLLLDADRTLVADHGLAHLLWAPAGQDVAQFNSRYSAPELFERQISRQCDQYSLALMYQELLTGMHPHTGQARRELARSRSGCLPGLDLLPAGDQEVIARALDWDPLKRWPSCLTLIEALEEATADGHNPDGNAASSPLRAAVTELVATVAGEVRRRSGVSPRGEQILRVRHHVPMPEDVVRQRADACRQQWHGQVTHRERGLYSFSVSKPLVFWQRWLGRQAGLALTLRFVAVAEGTEVAAEVRPYGCGPAEGARLVEGVAPLVLDSLAAALQVTPERRGQDRVPWQHPLWVRFILDDDKMSDAVECRGKDISLTGMGFYLPPRLPTSRVILTMLSPTQDAVLDVPATIVRVSRCSDEWYEVGARFLLDGGEFPPAPPAVNSQIEEASCRK